MTTVHLHVHSWFSFGRGTASPEALCLAAARQGVESIALTDLGGLYGIPEFLAAAHRHGIHPIVGAALPDEGVPRSVGSGRAVVLARDQDGWAEISRLLSRRHASPRMPLNALLEELSEHVWILSPDLSLLRAVRRVRGTGWLLAELRAGTRWEPLAEQAASLGLGVVGTAGVQLSDPSERRFQRLLLAVRERRPFARVARWELASERGWMLDDGGMRAAFSRKPEALDMAVEVARDCRCGAAVDPISLAAGEPNEVAAQELSERVRTLAARRYGDALPGLTSRLERELRLLTRGSRPESLLLLAEAAAWGRQGGRAVFPSAGLAGSVVAWCLDLTPVDPVAAGLEPEALCNDAVDGLLEADLLIADSARAGFVRSLQQRVGEDRVGRPARFVRWGLHDAVRDIARSAALRPSECERVLRQLPADWRGEGPDELLARCPRLVGAGLDEPPWDRILRAAARLAGVPHALGAGEGVVVGGRALADRVPSEHAGGSLVVQWDHAGSGAMGLLAARLPADRAAALLLRSGPGEAPPESAEETAAALGAAWRDGLLLGCPALEPRHVRVLLADGAVLDDVVAALAGVERAGTSEALIADASAFVGLVPDEADRLRRGLGPDGSPAERARLRRRFVEGALAAGTGTTDAAWRWEQLGAALRGAPRRAELLPLALGGLRMLEVARTRPAWALAALLTVPGGHYPAWVYVAGALRRGVRVLPPSVQDAHTDPICPGDGVVRLGLGQIRGVRTELAAAITDARRTDGRFASFDDFQARVSAGVDEVDALVAAGALDEVDGGLARDDLRVLHRRLRWKGTVGTRDRGPAREQQRPGARATQHAARLRDELGALGLTLSGHPLEIVADQLPDDAVQGAALGRCIGSQVTVAGWVAHVAGPGAGLDKRWRCELDDGSALLGARIPDRLVRQPLSGPWVLSGVVTGEGRDVLVEVSALRALELDGGDRAVADAG